MRGRATSLGRRVVASLLAAGIVSAGLFGTANGVAGASPGRLAKPAGEAKPATPFVESTSAVGLGVLVAWTPNAADEDVTSYGVKATPAAGSTSTACPSPVTGSTSVPASDTSAVVGGLCAGVVYTTQVTATNTAGSSAPSHASAPAVPWVAQVPSKPLLVSVTARTGSLLADWVAPAYDGGDALTGYKLTAADSSKTVSVSAAATADSATVTGLTNGRAYTVSLTASSAAGTSASATGTGTPSKAYAPSAPVGLTALANGSGGVSIAWALPSDDGGSPVTGYTISYVQEGQSDAGVWAPVAGAKTLTVSAAASATSATVASFTPELGFYLFSITASNAAGKGAVATAPAPVAPTNEVNSDVVVLAAASVSALASVSATALSWDDPAPAQVQSIAVGAILTSAPGGLLPEGTLRKVTAVVNAGGVLTLTTTQANLSQAFENMSLASNITAEANPPASGPVSGSTASRPAGASAGTPATLATPAPSTGKTASTVRAGLDGAVFVPSVPGVSVAPTFGVGATVTNSLTLSDDLNFGAVQAEGQFTMSTQIGMDINIRTGFAYVPDGVSVTASAKTVYSLEQSITLQGSATTELESLTEKLGELDLEPIPVDIGVPVVLDPKVPVFLKISGSVSVGFEATMTIGASVTWTSTKPGHLSATNLSKGPSLTGGPVPGLTVKGNAFVGLGIEPEVDIDDVAGPDFEADFGIEATINPDPSEGQYFFELEPVLKLEVGFAVDVFNFDPQLEFQFDQLNFPLFAVKLPPSASYAISPASPSVAVGKSITLKAVRSDGETDPVTWGLLGATSGDTITSSGVLTVGGPYGRTLVVTVRDATGAYGQATVTVGTTFYPPDDLIASQLPGHPFTADLAWTAPTRSGGSSVKDYTVVTEPSLPTETVTATSADLTGLTAATYVVSVFATNTAGVVSPPATALFAISPTGSFTINPGFWTATEAPLPANANTGSGDQNAALYSVSCPAEGSCVGLGHYSVGTGADLESRPVIEVQAGASWTDTEAPLLPDATAESGYSSVACGAPGSCAVVGQATLPGASGEEYPMVDTLADGKWSVTEPPLPSNAGPADEQAVQLPSVACYGAGSCVAVGVYDSTDGAAGLIETLSDGKWTAGSAPLPADYDSDLGAVTCPASGTCIALGWEEDTNSGYFHLLVETLSEGSWHPTSVPLPPDTDQAFAASDYVSSVACASADLCSAVGEYSANGATYPGPMIISYTGGVWKAGAAPLPANASTNSTYVSELSSATCGGTTCTAVGYYPDSSGDNEGLIETLTGSTWKSAEAPLPPDGAGGDPTSATLSSVICETSDLCLAVGSYNNYVDNGEAYDTPGLIEAFNGETWSPTTPPLPGNSESSPQANLGPGFAFNDQGASYLSCDPTGSCLAVGLFEDDNDNTQGLMETLNGGI